MPRRARSSGYTEEKTIAGHNVADEDDLDASIGCYQNKDLEERMMLQSELGIEEDEEQRKSKPCERGCTTITTTNYLLSTTVSSAN